MAAIFSITIFLSAFLLFLIQPMFSKMVLPLMGGGASVWNTCIVFFQLTLLAGYLYAHLGSTCLGVRRHARVHVALLAVSVVVLPIGVRLGAPPPGADPVGWLLRLLTVSVAVPFFFLSTTGPLLQRWFAETSHPSAANPYFMYSASNVGSLLALLAYPVVVERMLRLANQRWVWSAGYVVLVALVAACGWTLLRSTASSARAAASAGPREGAGLRARWIVLAAVPSGMMLALTTYLTTDIAPIPLLWVIPLALYLLSFVLAFARRQRPPHRVWVRLQPPLLIAAAVFLFWESRAVSPQFMVFHLTAFFVTAMVCHGELVRLRPPPDGLTRFYLWMSLGGAAGGMFSAIVAPLVFTSIAEYGWLLIAACALRPAPAVPAGRRVDLLDAILALSIGGLVVVASRSGGAPGSGQSAGALAGMVATCVVVATLLLLRSSRPYRMAAAVALLLGARMLVPDRLGTVVYAQRNFYGARRIVNTGSMLLLQHGGTTHGTEFTDALRRAAPTSYYHRQGPAGDLFASLPRATPVRVAVIGLGTGALAAYGERGDRFDFYEIDPEMVRMARDARWFTYLTRSAADVHVVVGDGRLQIANAGDGVYDLIVIDAFNSDAVPVHLLTREAIRLYLRKLRPTGILALHISNRYLHLRRVVASEAADLGVPAKVRERRPALPSEHADGLDGSIWAALAHDSLALAPLPGWSWTAVDPRVPAWDDDYSNIVAALRW